MGQHALELRHREEATRARGQSVSLPTNRLLKDAPDMTPGTKRGEVWPRCGGAKLRPALADFFVGVHVPWLTNAQLLAVTRVPEPVECFWVRDVFRTVVDVQRYCRNETASGDHGAIREHMILQDFA